MRRPGTIFSGGLTTSWLHMIMYISQMKKLRLREIMGDRPCKGQDCSL